MFKCSFQTFNIICIERTWLLSIIFLSGLHVVAWEVSSFIIWFKQCFQAWFPCFFEKCFHLLAIQNPAVLHTLVTYNTPFLSYIIAFSHPWCYIIVSKYSSPKTRLQCVTKSLRSLVASLCQRRFPRGRHDARLSLQKLEVNAGADLDESISQPLKGSQSINLLSLIHFTHMSFLSLSLWHVRPSVAFFIEFAPDGDGGLNAHSTSLTAVVCVCVCVY